MCHDKKCFLTMKEPYGIIFNIFLLFQTGFVPNVHQAFTHRPEEFRCFMKYYEVLMDSQRGSLWISLYKNLYILLFIGVTVTKYSYKQAKQLPTVEHYGAQINTMAEV